MLTGEIQTILPTSSFTLTQNKDTSYNILQYRYKTSNTMMVLPSLLSLSTLPPNPTNITVYHVNPANYTGITNMDTADGCVVLIPKSIS
jgi:hypothetical protein